MTLEEIQFFFEEKTVLDKLSQICLKIAKESVPFEGKLFSSLAFKAAPRSCLREIPLFKAPT